MAEKDGKFGKEIEINGSKVVVPDNVATAFQTLQEQNASLQSNYTTLNSQFTQLSSKLDNLKPPEKKEQDVISTDGFDWTNPDASLKALEDRIVTKVSSVLEENNKNTEAQNRKQAAQEKFYADFYKEHKEFRRDEDHFLVRSMLTEKAVEYGSLPDTKAVRKKLAEDAGKYLKARTVTKPPMVEGVENALPKPDEEEGEKTKVTSLSDILKAKQAKHRPEPLAPTGSEAQ